MTCDIITLLIGGARSGKSRSAQAIAENLAETNGQTLVYVATGQALDDEMADRIARHRAERGGHWQTIESPIDLPSTIASEASATRVLLIDCLTLWLSNVMLAGRDVDAAVDALVTAIGQTRGPLVVVSNEVGMGIVPDNALARRFRDAAGLMNQRVAGVADTVSFVAAGLSIRMK